MKIICFIKGIIRSISGLNIISGCDFVEKYDNKDVQILECEICGSVNVGYKKDSDDEDE